MRKLLYTAILTVGLLSQLAAQNKQTYLQVYPIGDDPNIRWMSSYIDKETILFEANPTVRFGFTNNFVQGLQNNKQHTRAWYIAYRGQLRMYTDNSLPVKMPSQRVLLGTQHMFRLIQGSNQLKEKFVSFSLESGHYSNGQIGCAFSTIEFDQTPACDSIYAIITPDSDLSDMLNRNTGNFSTNMTELIINFRSVDLDEEFYTERMHSVSLGYLLYHDRMLGIFDIGGFSDNDIKIYGRHRLLATYEYVAPLNWGNRRFSLKQNFELIIGAHNSVQPIRSETMAILFPFEESRALGFQVSLITGHDNYNYRFVDAGTQVTVGVTWSIFPPIKMGRLRDMD